MAVEFVVCPGSSGTFSAFFSTVTEVCIKWSLVVHGFMHFKYIPLLEYAPRAGATGAATEATDEVSTSEAVDAGNLAPHGTQ